MNVLICDDEWSVTEQVSELLQKHCAETGTQVRFHLFDAPCAIKDFAEYDIAILDIDMGNFSGIDLARRLRKEKPGIVIIFLTNFIQYAPEGFEVQAFRYLLKSDMQERLVSYFEDAVREVVREKQIITIWRIFSDKFSACNGLRRDQLFNRTLSGIYISTSYEEKKLFGKTQ